MFEYTVRRSNRARNISVRIMPPGKVEAVAPYHVSDSRIDYFVNSHSDWIEKKVAHFRQFSDVMFNKDITKSIVFLGKDYPVEIAKTSGRARLKLEFDKAVFYSNFGSKKELRSLLEKFYRKETKKIAQNLVSKKLKRNLKISVRGQKTRWGSCSTRGTLSLNWKLAIAPLPVFNYVICHEVAHLKHFNHSRTFWKEVEQMCPNYLEHRKWLRKKGFLMNF